MGNEASKAQKRRARHPRYANRYFVGKGIDIGPGTDGIKHHRDKFPLMTDVDEWDESFGNGDAKDMAGIADNTYDWVHSSHCLEHIYDVDTAVLNWIRITKPGGYLVITVPDEDLYEQGVWPSTFSGHQRSFTIYKAQSWSSGTANVVDILRHIGDRAKCISIGLHDEHYQYGAERFDQTGGDTEVEIEFILQKANV